jgi:CSLREA domain-containing protein
MRHIKQPLRLAVAGFTLSAIALAVYHWPAHAQSEQAHSTQVALNLPVRRLVAPSVDSFNAQVAAPNAPAASITVNSLADGAPANNGQCTLREAIINANNNNQSGSTDCTAGSGADTITFSLNGMINLTGALPDINESLTITGTGAAFLTVRRNTGGDYRIFSIPFEGLNININNMTISNGKVAGFGGGIFCLSSLTLTNCAIVNNEVVGDVGGGGVYLAFADGVFTGCTFSGNTGGQSGGAILYQGDGGHTLTLTNCTVSGATTAIFLAAAFCMPAAAAAAHLPWSTARLPIM